MGIYQFILSAIMVDLDKSIREAIGSKNGGYDRKRIESLLEILNADGIIAVLKDLEDQESLPLKRELKSVITEILLKTVPVETREDITSKIDENCILSTIFEEVIPLWNEEQKNDVLHNLEEDDKESNEKCVLLNILRVDEIMRITRSHQRFILKIYERCSRNFPNLTKKQVEDHDSSKFR